MNDMILDICLVTVLVLLGAWLCVDLFKRGALSATNKEREKSSVLSEKESPIATFLFRDEKLVDCTACAEIILNSGHKRTSDLDRLLRILSRNFPDVRECVKNVKVHDEVALSSPYRDEICLRIKVFSAGVRISIYQHEQSSSSKVCIETALAEVFNQEHTFMVQALDHSPQLIWQENTSGQLLWANTAYLSFCDDFFGVSELGLQVWPQKSPFGHLACDGNHLLNTLQRMSAGKKDSETQLWYDVVSFRQPDDTLLHFATNVDEVVSLEQRRRDILQAFGKTFAQLTTGLVIFDPHQNLVSFNPSFLKLSGLSPTFLSSRPKIDCVLDELRSVGQIPEPHNYKEWKRNLCNLLSSSTGQEYNEDWFLSSGQTYKVTGRPNGDGAFALFWEDITERENLTSSFRLEIETIQAVIDGLDESVVVFSRSGVSVLTNKPYRNMWGQNNETSLEVRSFESEMKDWKMRSLPSSIWGDLEQFVRELRAEQVSLIKELTLESGQHIRCFARKMNNNMTCVSFRNVNNSPEAGL